MKFHGNWEPPRTWSRNRARREFQRALRWLNHYDYETTAAPPFAMRAYNATARFPVTAYDK